MNKHYTKNSNETIIILGNEEPRERPIAVEGMRVHKPWQLNKLINQKRWYIKELEELERW